MEVDLTIPGTDDIRGMDIYEGHLYVHRDNSVTMKYTLDGVPVDSLNYTTFTHMAIHDSIIYDVDGDPGNRLRRYDMRTGLFLGDLASPAFETDGIRVCGGKLYYCDGERRMIGAVPLADLR
jgi:hypothetical protein